MHRIALTGLCRMELPDFDIRLCDGGRIVWGSDAFRQRDPVFGTIGSVQVLSEGADAEFPPLEMTMLPPSSDAAVLLARPTVQGSRVRFWLAEYSVATGAVIGTPTLKFDGQIDQVPLNLALEVGMIIVPSIAVLFEQNIGNSLSPAFHKSIWPGETGHDNATGLGRPVAWGVDAPPATTGGAGSGNLYGYEGGVPF